MNRFFHAKEVKNYIVNNNIRYVSFDLFDTLIFRSLHSSGDVYTLLYRKYDDIYGKSEFNLKQKRIQGEIKARSNSRTEDVTIDDIYSYIELPDLIKQKLKKIECELEIELSVSNREMIDFLDNIKSAGVTVLITTDMYLNQNTIDAILKINGIKYDHLFLSGNIGKRKDTGQLFLKILSELSINSNEIIHIGDNKNADYKIPEALGIRSYIYQYQKSSVERYFVNTGARHLYRKRTLLRRIYERIHKAVLRGCRDYSYVSIYSNFLTGNINATCKSESKASVRIGYGVIGPLMVAFCYWIHQKKIDEKLDQLWFVAREGYLIEKVYRVIYPEDSDSIRYVRYNKNICRLPFVLLANSIDDIRITLPSPFYNYITLNNLFTLFSIDDREQNLAEIKARTGYDINSKIPLGELVDEKNQLLDILVELTNKTGNQQKEYLIEHLHNTIGKKNEKVKVGLVNNSVNGNGQYMLERILKSQNDNAIEFCGLQFIDSESCKNKGIKYHSWLVEYRNQFYINVFNRTLNILERLIFENCGTAIMLYRNKDGSIAIRCEERNREKDNDSVLIPIQAEALRFAKYFRKYRDLNILDDALAIYFQMINYPSSSDAEIIGGLAYDEVEDNGTLIKSYNKTSKLDLLKNARREIWPNGYLSMNDAPKIFQDLFVWKDRLS